MRKVVLAGCLAMFGLACLGARVTVRGTGSVSVPPDMMRMSFEIEVVDKDMTKSAELFARQNAAVLQALQGVGVQTNELTVSSVEMNPKYHREDKEGNEVESWRDGKRIFDGYAHSVDVLFKAALDRPRLEKIYQAVIATKAAKEISIDFSLKDESIVRTKARQLAVADAKVLAGELAAAAGTELAELSEIRYHVAARDEYDDDDRRHASCCMMSLGGDDFAPVLPAIKIEDIKVYDSVNVSWELK